jgi:hypothetical protein
VLANGLITPLFEVILSYLHHITDSQVLGRFMALLENFEVHIEVEPVSVHRSSPFSAVVRRLSENV